MFLSLSVVQSAISCKNRDLVGLRTGKDIFNTCNVTFVRLFAKIKAPLLNQRRGSSGLLERERSNFVEKGFFFRLLHSTNIPLNLTFYCNRYIISMLTFVCYCYVWPQQSMFSSLSLKRGQRPDFCYVSVQRAWTVT